MGLEFLPHLGDAGQFLLVLLQAPDQQQETVTFSNTFLASAHACDTGSKRNGSVVTLKLESPLNIETKPSILQLNTVSNERAVSESSSERNHL